MSPTIPHKREQMSVHPPSCLSLRKGIQPKLCPPGRKQNFAFFFLDRVSSANAGLHIYVGGGGSDLEVLLLTAKCRDSNPSCHAC